MEQAAAPLVDDRQVRRRLCACRRRLRRRRLCRPGSGRPHGRTSRLRAPGTGAHPRSGLRHRRRPGASPGPLSPGPHRWCGRRAGHAGPGPAPASGQWPVAFPASRLARRWLPGAGPGGRRGGPAALCRRQFLPALVQPHAALGERPGTGAQGIASHPGSRGAADVFHFRPGYAEGTAGPPSAMATPTPSASSTCTTGAICWSIAVSPIR